MLPLKVQGSMFLLVLPLTAAKVCHSPLLKGVSSKKHHPSDRIPGNHMGYYSGVCKHRESWATGLRSSKRNRENSAFRFVTCHYEIYQLSTNFLKWIIDYGTKNAFNKYWITLMNFHSVFCEIFTEHFIIHMPVYLWEHLIIKSHTKYFKKIKKVYKNILYFNVNC